MGLDTSLTRKDFLKFALASTGTAMLSGSALASANEFQTKAATNPDDITVADVLAMEKIIGFSLTEAERKAVLNDLKEYRTGYSAVRTTKIDNTVAPPTPFVPFGKQPAQGSKTDVKVSKGTLNMRPSGSADLAFLPVNELAALVKNKKISPVELTELYLSRINQYGIPLLNVISITPARARAQAKKADEEIKAGKYRGPLHGIPYVIKDLFAAKGYPTTWGAEPFRNQMLNYDAAVIERLDAAGAVLIAKSSLGALAMNDHWFEGRTKNPWDTAQGSSGSSAGSASCMAAGLAAFAIGTETLGSIMSPSHRCRVTGFRPTFGRVSRYGAMALSWSMDKVGPICRTAQDCALVLAAIHGSDSRDSGSVDRPFKFRPEVDFKKLKIGYLSDDKGLDKDDTGNGPDDALKLLRELGANPMPIKFTQPADGIDNVLSVEAAAAFEEITRDRRVDTVSSSAWPAIFKNHQFCTGVGYIQAMRARTLLMQKFEEELGDFDLIVAADRGSYLLFITNLTGHPQLYVPFGVDKNKAPRGVSFIGRLYDEGTILAVGAQIQMKTDFWSLRPSL